MARGLKSGRVWINIDAEADQVMPMGGFKQSGFGRELGAESIQAFTRTKSVCPALPKQFRHGRRISIRSEPRTADTTAPFPSAGLRVNRRRIGAYIRTGTPCPLVLNTDTVAPGRISASPLALAAKDTARTFQQGFREVGNIPSARFSGLPGVRFPERTVRQRPAAPKPGAPSPVIRWFGPEAIQIRNAFVVMWGPGLLGPGL